MSPGFRRPARSGGRRLRRHGIVVDGDLDDARWFLAPLRDVRGSDHLEFAATEFHVQGLELDWVGVCWDADLRIEDGRWEPWNFKGTKWQRVNDPRRRQYMENKYRVLMTRARQGMVLWVPRGDDADHTRPRQWYDLIADHLLSAGVTPI